MKLNIMQITTKGKAYSFSREDWVVSSLQEALGGTIEESQVQVELDRYDKRVEARVTYSLIGTVLCSRCAQDIQIAASGAETLLFEPCLETQDEEIELEGEDLDIGWYEDGKLDLSSVICEAAVLSLPNRMHCSMEMVRVRAEGDCYVPPKKEERTLENLFADLLKKQ